MWNFEAPRCQAAQAAFTLPCEGVAGGGHQCGSVWRVYRIDWQGAVVPRLVRMKGGVLS